MSDASFHKGVKDPETELDGSSLKVLIVHTRWNSEIVEQLVHGTKSSLLKHGVKPINIIVRSVSGAYELPGGALKLIRQAQHESVNLVSNVEDFLTTAGAELAGRTTGSSDKEEIVKRGAFDAVICIGVLIKGSTMHFEYIADAVSHGLMRVGLDTGVPVVFGVLTCLDDEQAKERAGMGQSASRHNHGTDWGTAAVDMALLQV
ncbi:lumazine synthase [Coemansia spiralis]|uniref:6,7-dimethyl-8-ribityllumazine synthase n=2 Tax=Coemansia TaxID=4863 RepID=A0A9W8KX53_9FUNG|nr:dimethylribityllumazine synthase [Coemansia spiralis]KAJ1989760.1 lumazine synthase [Coemansia umbellata]KAJ2621366.1 lumazine synthase [Coemansia sp. RSA 1358]KAJ2673427.1 lumazine synthase [Coemansia spiralis]